MKKESLNNNNRIDKDNMEEEDDSQIFPQRLIGILSDESNQNAICWLPHGKSFIIRNRKLFAEMVMPKYFSRKAKYSSFTRKLNRWNFSRVSSGLEIGAYHHEFFLRDKPHLAAQMFCKNARTMLAMASSSPPPPKPTMVSSTTPLTATTKVKSEVRSKAKSENLISNSCKACKGIMDKTVVPAQLREESIVMPPPCAQLHQPISPTITSIGGEVATAEFPQLLPPMDTTIADRNANLLLAALAKDDANSTMALAYGNASAIQLVQRQMLLIQQAQQQEMTNRMLLSLQQLGQPVDLLGLGTFVQQQQLEEELNMQLRLRQMIEMNQRQEQKSQPIKNRAKAA